MVKVWIDSDVDAEFSDETEALRYAHMIRNNDENNCKYIYLEYPDGHCSGNIINYP